MSECDYGSDHETRIRWEDEDGVIRECVKCGAEFFDDFDPEGGDTDGNE